MSWEPDPIYGFRLRRRDSAEESDDYRSRRRFNSNPNTGQTSSVREFVLGTAVLTALNLFGDDSRTARANRERDAAMEKAENERLSKEKAEEKAKKAEEKAETERLAKEEAERKRKEMERLGICPDREVTADDIQSARVAVGYVKGRNNIGVTGACNAGKSTIVNCLRGVTDENDPTYAKVREVYQTTTAMPYIDNQHSENVYHDLPGGNVTTHSSWGYYYNQNLFAYDKLLLVHSDTPTELDVKINQICNLRGQECILVRSKADYHIESCQERVGHPTVEMARQDYISQVKEDTRRLNANASQLESLRPNFADYIVCRKGILQLVNSLPPSDNEFKQIIDEPKLLERLGLNGFSADSNTAA